jgi:4-carboxymuconolactone decarboxylase
MNDLQKKYAEEIIKGPRGALYNPFTTLIRSPELMDRAQKIGEYLRYKSAIGPRLTELVILIVARQWTQQVEWAIHEPIALKEGIKPDVIKAIADGRRPVGMSDDEELIYNFCMELHTNKSITDTTYDRVLKRFGEHGVIDTLGINGYYTFLAMVMNGTRTAVPDNNREP